MPLKNRGARNQRGGRSKRKIAWTLRVGWVRAKTHATTGRGRIIVNPILLCGQATFLQAGRETGCARERATLVPRNCASRGDQDCSGKSDLPRQLLAIAPPRAKIVTAAVTRILQTFHGVLPLDRLDAKLGRIWVSVLLRQLV